MTDPYEVAKQLVDDHLEKGDLTLAVALALGDAWHEGTQEGISRMSKCLKEALEEDTADAN
jgi:hypothetical protein